MDLIRRAFSLVRRVALRKLRGLATSVVVASRWAMSLVLRGLPLVLLVTAVAVEIVQPLRDQADLDALIAIAGLLATVLSLGLTVTLLVAQRTADKYGDLLYEEFRHERGWLLTLPSWPSAL